MLIAYFSNLWGRSGVYTSNLGSFRDRLGAAIYGTRSLLAELLGRRPKQLAARRKHEAQINAGPLSKEVVVKLTTIQVAKVDSDYLKQSALKISDEDLACPRNQMPMQHRGAALLLEVLSQSPKISSVANIGARVDVASAYLAPRFPHISFVAVDFQPNLREQNALLGEFSNLNYLSGYALNLFKSGQLRVDLVYMTSTSVLFNASELDAYIQAFDEANVSAIVLNEPWWPVGPLLKRPESVAPENPYCSGVFGHYHHNYIAGLTKWGYQLIKSTLEPTNEDGIWCLQLLAVKEQNGSAQLAPSL